MVERRIGMHLRDEAGAEDQCGGELLSHVCFSFQFQAADCKSMAAP
jgi:hypothetical protein